MFDSLTVPNVSKHKSSNTRAIPPYIGDFSSTRHSISRHFYSFQASTRQLLSTTAETETCKEKFSLILKYLSLQNRTQFSTTGNEINTTLSSLIRQTLSFPHSYCFTPYFRINTHIFTFRLLMTDLFHSKIEA